MECLKAVKEAIVKYEGVPMLADKRRSKEARGVWREEEKDINKHIIW